ncbi:MAG: hypothetical protein AAFZ15_30910 [Bacteroidota bacterium]
MATKKKTTAKKTNLEKNVNRIQKTAKSINKEVTKTTGDVIDNVVSNGKELRTLATKTIKEAGKKIDLNQSIEMIRKTTISVNHQVWKTAEEVLDDVTASGKEMVDVATKKAKEAIDNIDLTEGLDTVKSTAKKANKIALETADEVVEGVFANGEKWQDVAAKAVKGGMKLAGRQQEIVFDTLETVKDQLTDSAKRFRKLFGTN